MLRTPNNLIPAAPCSEPTVVEADTDAFGGDGIGAHLVAQPTLEQHHLTGPRAQGDPRAVGAPCTAQARRRRHEAIQPRILELQPWGSCRHSTVVGAAARGPG